MIEVAPGLWLAESEIEIQGVRAQGAGGQNVNKVASAVHLRFDIPASSLPEHCRQKLLQQQDQRLSHAGVLVIKAQEHRTFTANRAAALDRLRQFISAALTPRKRRIPTRPSRTARQRRRDHKRQRSALKSLRGPVDP